MINTSGEQVRAGVDLLTDSGDAMNDHRPDRGDRLCRRPDGPLSKCNSLEMFTQRGDCYLFLRDFPSSVRGSLADG